jgi:hypothetical protein
MEQSSRELLFECSFCCRGMEQSSWELLFECNFCWRGMEQSSRELLFESNLCWRGTEQSSRELLFLCNLYLIRDVPETSFCLRLQVEPTQLGPTDSAGLRIPTLAATPIDKLTNKLRDYQSAIELYPQIDRRSRQNKCRILLAEDVAWSAQGHSTAINLGLTIPKPLLSSQVASQKKICYPR